MDTLRQRGNVYVAHLEAERRSLHRHNHLAARQLVDRLIVQLGVDRERVLALATELAELGPEPGDPGDPDALDAPAAAPDLPAAISAARPAALPAAMSAAPANARPAGG